MMSSLHDQVPTAREGRQRVPGGRGLRWVALATAIATFPLIFIGGLVTSHQAGMSVPDWPNSYGYNMFLFPPRLWVGGILYEHTHRLMATVVGMLSILLVVVAFRTESRRSVRWFAAAVLGTVIFQGVLGGLRVVLIKLDLAVVHACFAQAFFCLSALVAVVTSKWWLRAAEATPLPGRGLWRAGLIACFVIYVQLVAGAVMRHYRAGLAIPDLPLAYGKLLPPTDAAGLAQVNAMRKLPEVATVRGDDIAGYEQMSSPVTLTQVWVHFAHRVGAVCVTIAVSSLVVLGWRRGFRGTTLLLAMLLASQLTLGVLTVLLMKPADVASAHVAVGALTLVTTFVLTAQAWRLTPRSASAGVVAEDRPAPVTFKGNLATQ